MAASAILAELHTNDDYSMLAKSVGQFADRELVPYLRQLGPSEFPARFISMAANNGFVGSAVPAEYGGQSGTLEALLSIVEGIAAADGSLALTLAAHESLATTHILLGGNDAQKRKYLPRLTGGRNIGAWCLTEPQAGSNIFHDMRAKLVRTPAGWELTGEKTFITNGCHADLFVVLARAIGEDGGDSGMTACVVERERNRERITRTALHDKMGMLRSDTAMLKFEEVRVPDDAILGPLGSGDQVARRVLLRGRVGIGALALGLARDSLERAVVYAKGRIVEGGSLFEQPLTRAKLSRMERNLWVAWQAVRSAAQCADQSKPFKLQACMAKVFATETALEITDEAVQILGGYGYMRDYKVEQNYRDARLLTIGEGASEILRFAITKSVLAQKANIGDILPPVINLAQSAGQNSQSMGVLWGPVWRGLQLGAESLQIVREQFEEADRQGDSAWAWQCNAAAFADLATRLWVCHQVILTGTSLMKGGSASQNQLELIRIFVIDSTIEICHKASQFLRTLGLTDATLCGNYVEALQIGAGIDTPTQAPVSVEQK